MMQMSPKCSANESTAKQESANGEKHTHPRNTDNGDNNDNNNHNNVLELEVRQGNARHGKAKQGKARRARGICANAFVIRLLLATHV